jgi:hypothetical protein
VAVVAEAVLLLAKVDFVPLVRQGFSLFATT